MKFKIRGYCLIPMIAETVVEAMDKETALVIAQQRFRSRPIDLIELRSEDLSSAHDWQPVAFPEAGKL